MIACTMAGCDEGLVVNGLRRVHWDLGRVPVRSDRDQALHVAARHKGHPVGIDPGCIAILGPGQDGRPFDHAHVDVVGEAHLHADAWPDPGRQCAGWSRSGTGWL